MKRPQLLDKILDKPNGELEGLVTHARQLRRLQGLYQQVVSENLAKNCQIANYQQGRLTLCCQSAAWSTRVKMERQQLLNTLCQSSFFSKLQQIDVITRPEPQAIENKEKTFNISMSATSAKTIKDMAQSISDPTLRDALTRLARHKNN